jgi:eukaryotic-like serine/threonine-protein kinase
MGEVYRAHDSRLGRDVAVKVLPNESPQAPGRIERFRQEARAVAALDHPHILALHDLGTQDGTLYAVFELLEGQTLRKKLQDGPLPIRKALELAVQICRGLHAAHARGIVHRDLKPENLFLARDGHLKILDFGLAELREPDALANPPAAGTSTPTRPSLPSGTFGYMSPEQLRGEAVGPASDIFAVGVVLYEMVCGKRPFEGANMAESMAAVFARDPPELTSASGPLPPALEPLVRRCLEKDVQDRFQSAQDIAFALEAVLAGTASAPARSRRGAARPARAWLVPALALAAGTGVGVLAGVLLRPPAAAPPVFTQLTFRRGWMNFARFAPDGRTVVYTAAWDGGPPEIYTTRTDSRVSNSLGLKHAALLSVSSKSELAILLDPHRQMGLFSRGTLATVSLGGGAPRELMPDVHEADWAPDGTTLAVLCTEGGEQHLEMPPGEVLYRSQRGLRLLRVSPDGRHVAFIEGAESNLRLMIVEVATRSARVLAQDLPYNLFGLAFSPGKEVWFTAGETWTGRDIVAVNFAGRRRVVYRALTAASLLDVAGDGRALLLRGVDRWGTMAQLVGDESERDHSIHDYTVPASVSSDGRTVLLDDLSQASGPQGAVYVHRSHTPPVRLMEGYGYDVLPDGRAVLAKGPGEPTRLLAVPTGATLPRPIDLGSITLRWAKWVPPEGSRVVVLGQEADRPLRLWLVERDGKRPARALGPEAGFSFFAVSPDGAQVATSFKPGTVTLLPVDKGEVGEIANLPADLVVGSWSGDRRGLFMMRSSVNFPCEVHRLDLATSKIELWKRVAPADATGISQCAWMNLSADGQSYAYGYFRSLADVVLAEGLR